MKQASYEKTSVWFNLHEESKVVKIPGTESRAGKNQGLLFNEILRFTFAKWEFWSWKVGIVEQWYKYTLYHFTLHKMAKLLKFVLHVIYHIKKLKGEIKGLMDTEFQFEKMKKFWSWMVLKAGQQ